MPESTRYQIISARKKDGPVFMMNPVRPLYRMLQFYFSSAASLLWGITDNPFITETSG